MSTHRQPNHPVAHRPARLALTVDPSASGIVDARCLRAEPLVPTLAATLARSQALPPPPRPRKDPWPLAVLCTALAVVVAFTGVAAASRLGPELATERARVQIHHLSMHAVSSSASPRASSMHPAPASEGAQ